MPMTEGQTDASSVVVASSAAEDTPSVREWDAELYANELEIYLLHAPDSKRRRTLLDGLDNCKRALKRNETRPRTAHSDKTKLSLVTDKLFRRAKDLFEEGLALPEAPYAATSERVVSLLRKLLEHVDGELRVSVVSSSGVRQLRL
jgi:hypothetical protein